MTTPGRHLHRQSGSVLVEAMVAVAVIAMMLAVTYRSVGESVLRARAAEASRTAGLIAQSRLAMVGAEIPLTPGDTAGVDGDFTWRVLIEAAPQDPSAMGQLLSVTASVRRRARGADLAVLHSQRLAPEV
jgi:type II secretory pathway pseudopilin PulG